MILPPILRKVLVETTPAVAFELFTSDIGAWWPLGELSVYGAQATVSFEENQRLVERAADGASNCWGEILTWDPPDVVRFTWHPGSPDVSSTVTVTFEPLGTQTLVVLQHDGWEAFGDPQAARNGYNNGWPMVLERYSTHAAKTTNSTDPGDATWVALLHRPGPQARANQSVFEQPEFADHVAFLNRMHDNGYLVAAGPLAAQPGEGMTILRLPGAGREAEATHLATEDDTSVASGFFSVTVQQWNVLFA